MSVHYENALPAGFRIDGAEPGQYEIMSILGAGGFGITYKARDHLLHSDVAIKEYLPMELALRKSDGKSIVPRASSQKDDYLWGLEQFMDEARILSRFKTEPNIVRVESFVKANNTAYMIMQYEEGEALDIVLHNNTTLSSSQINQLIMPILKGLRTIHRHDFLHRDIKPANIYIRKNDTPILLDFGAARQALSEHSRSVTGILTAGYAPFEQYSARAKLTPAMDLYAFGATLYKCMTGETPVEATERLNAIHNGDADPLIPAQTLSNNKYSPALYQTVTKLMQPLAKDRPQSVDEVIDFIKKKQAETSSENTVALDFAEDDDRGPLPDPVIELPKQKKSGLEKVLVPVTLIAVVAAVAVAITQYVIDTPAPKIAVVIKRDLDKDKDKDKDKNKDTRKDNNKDSPKIRVVKKDETEKPKSKQTSNQAQQKPTKQPPVVKKDPKLVAKEKALEHFKQALAFYSGSEGKDKNLAKAFKHFQIAAKLGHAGAQAYLAHMYLYGQHVPKNFSQSLLWSQKSAEQNHRMGLNLLGTMHQNGWGIPRDYRKAHALYHDAARQNHGRALRNLGFLYEHGLGVQRNANKAADYYEKAVKNGYHDAEEDLARLHRNTFFNKD